MTPAPPPPALGVVLVCPTGRAGLHRTLAAIAAQTIAHRIEVLVATPDAGLAEAEARLVARLHSLRLFVEPRIPNVDHMAARLLPLATAPIVAAIEDHAFPDPDWAERLLAQDDGIAAAFGSAMVNANPGSPFSWANMLIAYGQWSEATPGGPIGWVALHNGTYRRAALAAFGDDLWRLFNRDSEVLHRLKAAGATFRFAPAARIRHLNPSSLGATARLRFDAGRLAAAVRWRAEGWGWGRRLVYALSGPLIPLVRYRRMRRELFGPPPRPAERRHGPALFAGLVFDAAGQVAGFLAGAGGARERLAVFEMDRMQHLNAADRAAFRPYAGGPPAAGRASATGDGDG
jgi:hypothetical protein